MDGNRINRTVQWCVLSVLCVLIPASAFAEMAPPSYAPMEISDEEPNSEAEFPEPVVLEFRGVNRANRAELPSSTSGVASLSVDVHGYKSDYAGDWGEGAKYGLRFERIGDSRGPSPIPEFPVVLTDDSRLYIPFSDGNTRSERMDLTITATWVDKYGREGPTSDPARLIQSGNSRLFFFGCSAAGGGGVPSGIIAILVMVAALRLRASS